MAGARCNHSGCYCKGYIVPTSKWSKGNCKNCNHAQKEHAELNADVSFESKKVADAPVSNSALNAQIDGKMGIAPSGKTNYKDVGGGGGGYGASSNTPSIYSITLDENDWINWSAADLLVWFQQKKKFPDELSLKSIEHEMQTKTISGEKMTQLSQSTMLSYGFTDYNHRTKLMEHIKALLEQHPPGTQTLKIKPNAPSNNSNVGAKAEEKQEPKTSVDEEQLLQSAKLNESQWKTWSADQVWAWICIKQGWADKESMEYLFVHKLNEYEAKLTSADVNLSGSKLKEVQQDIKTQTLLKAIGFTFSQRKQIYKDIDSLLKHNP